MISSYAIFPMLNAALNGTSAILLVTAHGMIQQERWPANGRLMLAAVVTSSFIPDFLHLLSRHVGSVGFPGRRVVTPPPSSAF